MADVRSLLRSERASRRLMHPHLSYSAAGTLICLVCSTQVKSESLWESHLSSQQHNLRLQRGINGSAKKSSNSNAPDKRKRNAEDDEESDDNRKRAKGTKSNGDVMRGFLPEGFFDGSSNAIGEPDSERDDVQEPQPPADQALSNEPASPKLPASTLPSDFFDNPPADTEQLAGKVGEGEREVDEDEWAAFERDIASAEASAPPSLSALTAAATISAPALTASQIAARSTEEANLQAKERKEAELEAEKEDAIRHLEEEFDEMESLEERVRRLREKREELRRTRASIATPLAEVDMVSRSETPLENGAESDSDADEENGDDWDEWRLHDA